ncbi:MAG: L,D-transpeptidase, partial [Pseudodonghicola sp.]
MRWRQGGLRHLAALVLAALTALTGAAAAAPLEAWIDKSDQQMTVYLDYRPVYRWPVSTARSGKETPNGTFRPQSLQRMHYSTLYDNAPMPFSIFFSGDYAIHGTTETRHLGHPASAGCIRLSPAHAEILFNLVRQIGLD